MDWRVAYLIVSFLVVFVGSIQAQGNKNTIRLAGSLSNPVLRSFSGVMDSFVVATLEEGNTVLDLAFLDQADDLTVEVYGNDGVCIFSETTDVINGLHLIVDLTVSNAWAFEIYIYDDFGTSITGFFELP